MVSGSSFPSWRKQHLFFWKTQTPGSSFLLVLLLVEENNTCSFFFSETKILLFFFFLKKTTPVLSSFLKQNLVFLNSRTAEQHFFFVFLLFLETKTGLLFFSLKEAAASGSPFLWKRRSGSWNKQLAAALFFERSGS